MAVCVSCGDNNPSVVSFFFFFHPLLNLTSSGLIRPQPPGDSVLSGVAAGYRWLLPQRGERGLLEGLEKLSRERAPPPVGRATS